MSQVKQQNKWNSFKPFVIYLIVVLIFFWIVHNDWSHTKIVTESISPDRITESVGKGEYIEQEILIQANRVDSISFMFRFSENDTSNIVHMEWFDEDSNPVQTYSFPAGEISNDTMTSFELEPALEGFQGKKLLLRLSAEQRMQMWSGDSVHTGRYDIKVTNDELLRVNGTEQEGKLVVKYTGSNQVGGTGWYWAIAVLLPACFLGLNYWAEYSRRHGKETIVSRIKEMKHRYSYLLKQLVIRDFKVKYKASLLGVIWSFLNPLLMTLVYYIVFSTLFHSDIENFVVYLMSGIVLFNFFSESTSLGLNSIIGNAGLITKVYLPKYVFPISKVLSTSINLLISMAPLMIFMAITGVKFTRALLLLPVVAVFLILFCIGISLMLSAITVFFRDIQFLWSVFVTIVNFLSPVFYPETIIPAAYRTLYHLNPMYQYMYFMRTITLEGISPEPSTYLYCFLASFISLVFGLIVFRKCQDKFSLYL